jgi:hypothetical protein
MDTRALNQMEGDGQILMEKCLKIWMSEEKEGAKL